MKTVRQHAREVHDMELTREQVLAGPPATTIAHEHDRMFVY